MPPIDSFSFQPPAFGPGRPVYPHLMQAVRVTSSTMSGPTISSSSSTIAGPVLYLSYVQQFDPLTLLAKDREPCLVMGPTGGVLGAGDYDARLIGSYGGVPLFKVGSTSGGAAGSTINNYNTTVNNSSSTFNNYGDTFNYYATTTVNINNTFTTTIFVGAVSIVEGPGYFIMDAPFVQCGLLFWCWTTYAVTSAQLDNWAFPFTTTSGGVVIRMTATADFIITGISLPVPATGTAGNVFALANCSTHVMTVVHQNASSLAANRFDLEDGLDQTVGPSGIALFWYDPSTQRIRCFRESDGGSSDILVKVDAADTTAGYLADSSNGKLIAGTGITFTINNVAANETVTISATGAGTPVWTKFTKTRIDFSAAAFTNTINLTTPAAGVVLHAVKVKQSAAFTGGGITGYILSVGNSRLTNGRYLSNYTIFTAATDTNFTVSTLNQPDSMSHAGTDVITVTVGSQTSFLNAATAGSVDIWLLMSTPP